MQRGCGRSTVELQSGQEKDGVIEVVGKCTAGDNVGSLVPAGLGQTCTLKAANMAFVSSTVVHLSIFAALSSATFYR